MEKYQPEMVEIQLNKKEPFQKPASSHDLSRDQIASNFDLIINKRNGKQWGCL